MSNLSPRLQAFVDQMEAGLADQERDDFQRLQEMLLSVQVCTSLPDEEATARMNLTPSGTSGGWQLSEELKPVPCAAHPDTHRHLIFDC